MPYDRVQYIINELNPDVKFCEICLKYKPKEDVHFIDKEQLDPEERGLGNVCDICIDDGYLLTAHMEEIHERTLAQ